MGKDNFHEVNWGEKIQKYCLKFKQLFPFQTLQQLGKFFFLQKYITSQNKMSNQKNCPTKKKYQKVRKKYS